MSGSASIRLYNQNGAYVELVAGTDASNSTLVLPQTYPSMGEKEITPTDGSYTFTSGDVGKVVVVPSATETTMVVPQFETEEVPPGQQLTVFNEGPERVKLTAAPGVTIQNLLSTPPFYIPKYGTVMLRHRGDGTWAAWGDLTGGAYATGGTVTEIDGWRIHTFMSSGDLTFERGGEVEYLIVAGGGPGSKHSISTSTGGGGGGAGGVLSGTAYVSPSTYSVVVGAGGSSTSRTDGFDSSVLSLTATGGGCSGYRTGNANSGGSGGGAAYDYPNSPGAGIAGQGNAGGNAITSPPYRGGGGGGAGAAGAAGSGTGNGGIGVESSISGTATYYGGGGGAGVESGNVSSAGTGGLGGGGRGGYTGAVGISGTDGTGGGGGGAVASLNGGNGGDGIVIVRYRRM